jgi:uncharacterized membrane protein YhaH (DUF805 family)
MSNLLFSIQGRANRAKFWLVALGIVVVEVATWISIAVAVKRYHDRNKSGWWMLIV